MGLRLGVGLGWELGWDGGDLQRGRARACASLPVMRATDTERGIGVMSIEIWMFSAGVSRRLHGTKY